MKLTPGQIWKGEDGLQRITSLQIIGEWATVGVEEGYSNNRSLIINTERLNKDRTVQKPMRNVRNDFLLAEIRRGTAAVVTEA